MNEDDDNCPGKVSATYSTGTTFRNLTNNDRHYFPSSRTLRFLFPGCLRSWSVIENLCRLGTTINLIRTWFELHAHTPQCVVNVYAQAKAFYQPLQLITAIYFVKSAYCLHLPFLCPFYPSLCAFQLSIPTTNLSSFSSPRHGSLCLLVTS